VVRTRVGYTGGTTANPTYYELGDHTETVQIDYDPTQISYADLLEVFWDSHSPTYRTLSFQYRSAIFYHNEEQKQLALESKREREKALGATLYTDIEAAGAFYLAEDYHQKYYLRNQRSLIREFQAIYPDTATLIGSTAVARANGYVGGHGTPEDAETILQLGLSQEATQKLLIMVGSDEIAPACPVPALTTD